MHYLSPYSKITPLLSLSLSLMDEVGEYGSLMLWESNNSWAFENLGGGSGGGDSGGGGGSEEKSEGKKIQQQIDSTSNTPKEVVTASAVVPVAKKRGRGGGKANKGGGGGGSGGGEPDHEIHIWTERERRKKMRNMFANLHALLPQLPPKADKSTIVDEAVNYINTLQTTLQKLQKQKLERLHGATAINYDPSSSSMIAPKQPAYDSREAFLADQGSSNDLSNITLAKNSSMPPPGFPVIFQTWTSQNVTLNVCGNQAQINICSTKKPGLLTAICHVLEKYKLEVVSAHVSSHFDRCMYMIQTYVSSTGTSSDQFLDTFAMEEMYKQAAGEIMFWVSS